MKSSYMPRLSGGVFSQLSSRFFGVLLGATMVLSAGLVAAADEAPDALIKRISSEVMQSIKADPGIQVGDITKVSALVDNRIMPNVNFVRMTASAVGRNWRQATPEQQKR